MNPGTLVAATFALLLAGCALDLGQGARFGNYGGPQAVAKPEPPFDIRSTTWETRWFPTHVRWAPDDSHLLVSLCHVNRASYCRIGKYWIADKRWELLPLEPRTTYRWPAYSPDGKHIVATVASCNEEYRCHGPDDTLTLLSPDGSRVQKLIRTYADHPSFSDDGRKIIYWRLTGGGGADVAMFDLDTGKEEKLTNILFETSSLAGGAYFLPGGQRFVFGASLPQPLYGSRTVFVDGKPVEYYVLDKQGTLSRTTPVDGTKHDPRGPNRGVLRRVADRRDGVVTRATLGRLELLWPDNGASATNGGAEDVNRKGEVLYFCPITGCLAKIRADGRYRVKGIDLDRLPEFLSLQDPKPSVHVLRADREDAIDVSIFVINASASVTAISGDSQRLAFARNTLWHHSNRLGIATLGNPDPEFIDWPRLELDPAAMQALTTQ